MSRFLHAVNSTRHSFPPQPSTSSVQEFLRGFCQTNARLVHTTLQLIDETAHKYYFTLATGWVRARGLEDIRSPMVALQVIMFSLRQTPRGVAEVQVERWLGT